MVKLFCKIRTDFQSLTLLLLIFMQITSLALEISSIFVQEFASINSQSVRLYECSSRLCLFSSYNDNYHYYCDLNSLVSSCKLFKGLYEGMISYLVCILIAIFLGILSLNISIYSFMKNFYTKSLRICTIICGSFCMAFSVSGVISYIVLAKIKFNNCNQNYGSEEQPSMCPKQGIVLGLASSVLNVFTFIFLFVHLFVYRINAPARTSTHPPTNTSTGKNLVKFSIIEENKKTESEQSS